jgi:hypothetical protein
MIYRVLDEEGLGEFVPAPEEITGSKFVVTHPQGSTVEMDPASQYTQMYLRHQWIESTIDHAQIGAR